MATSSSTRRLGSATVWPLAAGAQQRAMPVIGVLYGVSAADWTHQMTAFHQGLREMGFVEGHNVAVEYRWADGQLDRMAEMARDLVERKVAVILVGAGLPGVRATIAATKTIPIVFTANTDPVAAGVVASLNRPGANVTGVTGIGGELTSKRLQLMQELIPKATKFAVLINPTNSVTKTENIRGAETAARGLGLEVIFIDASSEDEINRGFARAIDQGAAGLLADDAYFESRREQIAALGLRYHLPTHIGSREAVAAGALFNYGASVPEFYRQAGVYVGRILKSEKPRDLPILQPTKFELTLNLKTAKALGLTIPETLLATADEVIQ
jgi:putative tryptophan/tyrosine transport system substrate-binding protein